MPVQTTYTAARANLAKLCDRVADDRETVVIRRRGRPDVALVALDELASLSETVHLLRSPRNRKRLTAALREARSLRLKPQTVDQLRREVGLGKGK